MKKHDSGRELIARTILIHDNCLLVNHSVNKKTGQSYCALPGGHVDPGESCVAAVTRECLEELGIAVTVGDLCFACEQIYPGRSEADGQRHELTLLFHGALHSTPKMQTGKIFSPEAGKNFAWLPLDELKTAPLLPAAIKTFLLDESAPPRYDFSDET